MRPTNNIEVSPTATGYQSVTVDPAAIEMQRFAGPSIFAPFAAVVGEFAVLAAAEWGLHGAFRDAIFAKLPGSVVARIQTLEQRSSFETLVAGLAQALQDWHGPNDLPCKTDRTSSGRGLVCLGYHDEPTTAQALRLAYELALVGCGHASERVASVLAGLSQLGAVLKARQPTEVERTMIRAAREREIPFYRVVPGLLQYGQGKHGRHFLATSSQCDSNTGTLVQHDKVLSNTLVRQLGFPGVEHGVAETADNAVRLARQLGYPLVIKPIDGRQGQGVTAQVTSEEEIVAAFAVANAVSPGRVVIERFVEGDDVRITAICGRFARAVLRAPPRLVGDGSRTVMELIDIENRRRPTGGPLKRLTVDAAMLAFLQKQSLHPNDVLPAGQIVSLRSVASAAAGGTLTAVTDRVHPDNVKMVEAIARCFRLDTIGIDFLTPDIAKSWREVRCAVIEVNARPTITSIEPIRMLFERTFRGAAAGRIPSAIVLSARPAQVKEALASLRRDGPTIGFAEGASLALGSEPRVVGHVRLAERVQALLLDPACEALIVACTPEEIIHQGLPLDRFDLCVLEPEINLWERLRSLLEQCSKRIIENAPVEATLTQWLDEIV